MSRNAQASSPPAFVISRAEEQARIGRDRPGGCVKSNRGAVIWTVYPGSWNPNILGAGYNGQPGSLSCVGTDACRSACGRTCQHAEARAVTRALELVDWNCGGGIVAELVHVKLGSDGLVVSGGPPSCVSCSGMILDVGFIAAVWLYELPTVAEANAAGVFHMDDPRHAELAAWRRYAADEFHRRSLENAGVRL